MELFYPLAETQSAFEIKGSCFISMLIPIQNFENTLLLMRQEHTKAVHFVTASRFLNPQEQIEESFSDDGEPKGTSGMPTLKVLRGYNLIDCALLTIRYFGGTLLGTGGLVRAYTQGAKEVILKAKDEGKLKLYIPQSVQKVFVCFSCLNKIEYLAKKMEIVIFKREFLETGVELSVQGCKNALEHFMAKVEELNF